MSLSRKIFDIPALAKIASDVSIQCSVIAKDAPDGLRNLVNDVESLQGTLKILADDVVSNFSFFERMDDGRKLMLERCVSACFETFQRLNDLLGRYQELSMGSGNNFRRSIKWAAERTQVENIRSRVMVHTSILGLYMSPIGK